jgi:hypothetical protein
MYTDGNCGSMHMASETTHTGLLHPRAIFFPETFPGKTAAPMDGKAPPFSGGLRFL